MSKVLIIGCGGVANVAIRKCCQNYEVFPEIMIASRTKSKCDDLKRNWKMRKLLSILQKLMLIMSKS